MVDISLDEIFGRPIDTADTRVMRLRISFEEAVTAFLDMRFDDARHCLDEIIREIDDVESLCTSHGLTRENADAAPDPSEHGD